MNPVDLRGTQKVPETELQQHLQAVDALVSTDLKGLSDRLRAGNATHVADRP